MLTESNRGELLSQNKNNTWDISPCPSNNHLIACNWVYSIEFSLKRTLGWFKSQLVVLLNKEEYSVDMRRLLHQWKKWLWCELLLLMLHHKIVLFVKWILKVLLYMVMSKNIFIWNLHLVYSYHIHQMYISWSNIYMDSNKLAELGLISFILLCFNSILIRENIIPWVFKHLNRDNNKHKWPLYQV